MLYFVYIVRCADGSFYVGYTNDLEKRTKQHNGLLKGGAAYTRSRRPVTLVYTKPCETRSFAMKEEYRLKQLTHKQKESLCLP